LFGAGSAGLKIFEMLPDLKTEKLLERDKLGNHFTVSS